MSDSEPDSAVAPPMKWTGAVRAVTGRGNSGGRGLPPVDTLTISGPAGVDLTVGPIRDASAKTVRVQVLGVPEQRDFEVCPICGSPDDRTREHVPQRDLGGTVMTQTCGPCNNGLGSRVEDELRHWFDDALFDVRFSGGDVRGARKAPRLLRRAMPDGQWALVTDTAKGASELTEMFASGSVEVQYRVPNPRVWRVAALKHAYLGACLALGEIPNTEHSAILRGVLVGARDLKRGELPVESNLAKTLRVARSRQPAQGPTVLLVALIGDDDEVVDYGLSFAGTLFVAWPLDAVLFWKAVRRLASVGQTDQ